MSEKLIEKLNPQHDALTPRANTQSTKALDKFAEQVQTEGFQDKF